VAAGIGGHGRQVGEKWLLLVIPATMDTSRAPMPAGLGVNASSLAFSLSLQGAEVFWHIDRVRLQHGQVDHVQRTGISGRQDNRRGDSRGVRLKPAIDNNTPSVAGPKTREAVLGHRCDQVVSHAQLMLQKFSRHHRAHQMNGPTWAKAATTIAVEASERVGSTGLQLLTEDVAFTIHNSSLNQHPEPNLVMVWMTLR